MGTVQWILLITSGLAGVAGAVRMRHHRRFRRDMARLARRLNLHYTPEDRLDLLVRFAGLQLMRRGHNRRAVHVITGGTRYGFVTCFRLSYELGSGCSREVREWMLTVLETDLDLPPLVFLPPDEPAERSSLWSELVPDDAAPWAGSAAVQVWSAQPVASAGPPTPPERAVVEQVCAVLAGRTTRFGVAVGGHLVAACTPGSDRASDAESAMEIVTDVAGRAHGNEPRTPGADLAR